jgi:hypothetical protein
MPGRLGDRVLAPRKPGQAGTTSGTALMCSRSQRPVMSAPTEIGPAAALEAFDGVLEHFHGRLTEEFESNDILRLGSIRQKILFMQVQRLNDQAMESFNSL